MDGANLWSEGVTYRGPQVDALGRLAKRELRLGRATSLASMAGEYVFFTPAILYVRDLVDDRPLIDLQVELNENIEFFHRKFRFPIFQGLHTPDGDAEWNHVLWAVRPRYWECLVDFYCSIAIRNHDNDTVNRVGFQELTIVDPLAMEHAGMALRTTPLLEIGAFGIDGEDRQTAFHVSTDPLLRPPSLRYYPPSEHAQAFVTALRQGDNPNDAQTAVLDAIARKELG